MRRPGNANSGKSQRGKNSRLPVRTAALVFVSAARNSWVWGWRGPRRSRSLAVAAGCRAVAGHGIELLNNIPRYFQLPLGFLIHLVASLSVARERDIHTTRLAKLEPGCGQVKLGFRRIALAVPDWHA